MGARFCRCRNHARRHRCARTYQRTRRTEWEGFETATLAAAAGGSDDHYRHAAQRESGYYNARGFIEKLEASKGKMNVNVGFYAGLVRNSGQLEAR
jgi:allantoinase